MLPLSVFVNHSPWNAALFLAVSAVGIPLALMIGLADLSGWLFDSGDRKIEQTQTG